MGKHSAPKAAAQTVLPSGSSPAPAPAPAPSAAHGPHAHRTKPDPVPAVLAQTVAFGALAVIVAVVVLVWAGVGGREAAVVGAGLLAVGAVCFLVVRRTGLIAADPAHVGAEDPHAHQAHP